MTTIEPAAGGFLAQLGARTTSHSLTFATPPSWEQYRDAVSMVSAINAAAPFWTGDIINSGEDYFGEAYAQLVNELGYAPQTLANYAYVCRRIEPERRRPELSYGHHAAVASLTAEEQDRWLQHAVEREWSREELRGAVRGEAEQRPAARQEVQNLAAAEEGIGRPERAAEALQEQPPESRTAELHTIISELLDSAQPAEHLLPRQLMHVWAIPGDVLERLGDIFGRDMVLLQREPVPPAAVVPHEPVPPQHTPAPPPGPPMRLVFEQPLSAEQVEQVNSLLRSGKSPEEVAAITGGSLQPVAAEGTTIREPRPAIRPGTLDLTVGPPPPTTVIPAEAAPGDVPVDRLTGRPVA